MGKVINNRTIVSILSILIVALLTACGMENRKVFSINGESFTYKDVLVFGLAYTEKYNIDDVNMMKETYEQGQTYGDYHKQRLEKEIIDTLLLYKEAQSNNVELSDDAVQKVKDLAKTLEEDLGEDYLNKHNITRSDIEKIYEMQTLGDVYIQSISQVDEESEEAVGQDSERYIKVYQVLFPIVALDSNGMVQSDKAGRVKKLSDTEIENQKNAAAEFAEQVKGGADIEKTLKKYGNTVTGSEQYLKYSDLEGQYRKIVDSLSEGAVSESFESNYGYYIIKLSEKDARDYASVISERGETVAKQSKTDEELERLYGIYIDYNEEYKNEKLWSGITMEQFVNLDTP